jgi:TRAP-type C4-dicarboxylate transport system substrate-binding protein
MLRLAPIAVAAILYAGAAVAAAPLKLATLAPEGSPWHDLLVDIAQGWNKASGGQITVRIYAGGVAGDEADMIRKMRIGQLQLAALTGVGLSEIAPEIQALQMPMMFDSYAELDYVRDRLAPKLEALMEKQGFKILSWSDAGWVRFFTQRPAVRPADLKPMKIFTWEGDPTYAEAMKAMGYQPVPMAATDIYTGLQSGLINAFPTTPIAALSYQWFGLANHMTDVKWAPLVGALVISNTAWQSLPDALKPVVVHVAQDAARRSFGKIRALDLEAITEMKTHGLVVHDVPPDALAEWRAVAQAGYRMIVDKAVPAATVTEVERLRDAYRASGKTN